MEPIRLWFFGTSDFAVPIFERLANDSRFTITAVVTQPDRPVGRKAILTAPPIKTAAQAHTIPVFQFEQVKSDDAFAQLKEQPVDLAIVASFGQIIPQRVLDLSPHGFINVHASVLPFYRGASPITAAIKNGDAETGITIMLMDARMDHGPILAIEREPITENDTTETLSARLAKRGAALLLETVFRYLDGDLKPQEQDHARATTVKLLRREDGLIDWTQPAEAIERTVRAYDPWPGTYTIVDGKRLKILQTAVGPQTDRTPGTFFLNENRLTVACGERSSLLIQKLQPEGKPVMDDIAYLRGHRLG